MVNRERLLHTFLKLVQIDSPSGSEQAIAGYIAALLRALGLEPKIDGMHNVTVHVPGQGEPLFFNAHVDNVEPGRGIKPIVRGERITSDGTTVLGADDKAGVAAILEGLKVLHEEATPHLPLEIAFTTREEMGLEGARALDVSQFSAKQGIVFDGTGPVGTITVAAPSMNKIQIAVVGRGTHSGLEPERGINALQVAARAISRIELGRIDHETTTNLGIFQAGTARNVVPEKATITGEARSHNPATLDRVTAAMKAEFTRAAEEQGAKLDFRVEGAYTGFKLESTAPVVQRITAAVRQVGREPRYEVSGGGYEANVWNPKGISSVVVSVGAEDVHSVHEYLSVNELVRAAELFVVLAKG